MRARIASTGSFERESAYLARRGRWRACVPQFEARDNGRHLVGTYALRHVARAPRNAACAHGTSRRRLLRLAARDAPCARGRRRHGCRLRRSASAAARRRTIKVRPNETRGCRPSTRASSSPATAASSWDIGGWPLPDVRRQGLLYPLATGQTPAAPTTAVSDRADRRWRRRVGDQHSASRWGFEYPHRPTRANSARSPAAANFCGSTRCVSRRSRPSRASDIAVSPSRHMRSSSTSRGTSARLRRRSSMPQRSFGRTNRRRRISSRPMYRMRASSGHRRVRTRDHRRPDHRHPDHLVRRLR